MTSHDRRSPNVPPFDIQSWLGAGDGLPQPDWERITDWVTTRELGEQEHELWVEIERQWLETVGPAIDPNYRAIESEHILLLIDKPDTVIDRFLGHAEQCRQLLLDVLPGTADFGMLGKQVVFALNNAQQYYRYVEQFDGRDGMSSGMHIRRGHPHIALNAYDMAGATSILAHELTHASLLHLAMPLWLEEGLAQMFQQEALGRHELLLDAEKAREHKAYWHEHGLAEFWHGDGFSSKENVQQLSYQLAEITVRLLIEDYRPRWLGFARGKQRQLTAFLNAASHDDCGAAAAEAHLGVPISDLPAKFLGHGPWLRGFQPLNRTEHRNEPQWCR